jgi:hypothetical protein
MTWIRWCDVSDGAGVLSITRKECVEGEHHHAGEDGEGQEPAR